MIVLGIGGSVHDFSCCLVVDGEVVAAIEEERLSRVKYHPLGRISTDQLMLQSVQYCLDSAGVSIDDVDHVVANDLLFPGALRGLPVPEFINHHVSHAAAAYFLSSFAEAAVLVMDGFGSMSEGRAETASHLIGKGPDLALLSQQTGEIRLKDLGKPFSWANFDYVEDSLGVFYSYVTDLIGFGEYEEGKTMGLAAYGTDALAGQLGEVVPVADDGSIRFRAAERAELERLYRERLASASDDFQVQADMARAAQSLLERSILRHAHRLREATGLDNLCISGGIFMNCAANYFLVQDGPFRNVYVHGASGDNGTGIGAAMYGYHRHSGTGRTPMTRPVAYTGRTYTEERSQAALTAHAASLTWHVAEDVCAETARLLAGRRVVGWFQNGSEFGARALGNRSILADPRDPGAKDRINAMVKGREAFRPFAPSVLAERQLDYYDVAMPSPYMCINARVLPGVADQLPAVTHVDGTARFHTVESSVNPLYHRLISEFAEITGVGVLLNTSFNEREPIVETPEQAIDCYLRTDMDVLVLGRFIVEKRA
jgi:carbamoyltransferase